jgi:hypothetical protein
VLFNRRVRVAAILLSVTAVRGPRFVAGIVVAETAAGGAPARLVRPTGQA